MSELGEAVGGNGGAADRVPMDPARVALLSRGVGLEVLTVGWNLVEAGVAVLAGVLAGSIALVGFGLDSVIETIAAGALLHRLSVERKGGSPTEAEAGERRALWVVGATFLLLSFYISVEAAGALVNRDVPADSLLGIVLAAVSLVVMPVLGVTKLRTGRALGSRALVADAKETFACAYLSFTLLLGLALHALLGWWWADPVAALAMVPWILREGWEAVEEARDGDDDEEGAR